MDIKKSLNGDCVTLKVSGRLETASAPMLQSEITSISADVKRLLIDMTGLEYVSSAGLRVILLAHREMTGRGGRLEITGANQLIHRVFDISGFSPILNFI